MEATEMIAKKYSSFATTINYGRSSRVADDPRQRIGMGFDAEKLDLYECRRLIIQALYNDVRSCPQCHTSFSENIRMLKRFENFKRVRCLKCGKWFTAVTDTPLSHTSLDVREIVLLIFLVRIQCPLPKIATILGRDHETIRLWQKKYKKEL